MAKECTICTHSNRRPIEALIRNGVSLRKVAREYHAGVMALSRHKGHMAPADPLALPERKRRYVEARVEGKSKRQASVAAGYAVNTPAKRIEAQPDVRQAFAALIRETIPPEQIAKAIAEGISAKETKFFAHEGKVQDERQVVAWSERRQYAQLATEYGGYHVPDKDDREQGGGVILILPRPAGLPKNGETAVVIEGEASRRAGPIVVLPGGGTNADSD